MSSYFNSICGSTLWNDSLSWNTTNPDLTPCFQETILVWIPCLFLLVTCPYELYSIKNAKIHRNQDETPWTFVSILKLLLPLILVIITSLEFINALIKIVFHDNQKPVIFYPIHYLSPFLKMMCFLLVSRLIMKNRKRHLNSSGVLFIFWLLMSIGSVVTYRSMVKEDTSGIWMQDKFSYCMKLICVPLIIIELVLTSFTEFRAGISTSSSSGYTHSSSTLYFKPGQDMSNPSPEWSSSFLSVLTFWWFNPIILLGYKKPLKQEDLYDLAPDRKALSAFNDFSKYWQPLKVPSIIWPLFRTFLGRMLIIALCKFFASLLMFVNPIILNYLLKWMVDRDPNWHGFFFAFVMFGSTLCESMLNQQYEYNLAITSLKMRSAVTDVLYQKSLRLAPAARNKFTTGQIVNLMSVDCQRILDFILFFNVIWSAPLQIGISIYLLWQQLGLATLAGVAVMILLVPFNTWITGKWKKNQVVLMDKKDMRSKIINEVLAGIKVLKLYAWEPSFMDQVKKIRRGEINTLKTQSYYMLAVTFSLYCAPIFVALSSFVTYTLMDSTHVLDASRAFVSLTLFNIIRLPLTFIPLVVTFGTMFFVSMKRINDFLNGEETDLESVTYQPKDDSSKYAIQIKDACFAWTKEDAEPVLKDINLEIPDGALVAVVGRVGVGKSSLLSSLLCDTYKTKGSVILSGCLAYVPQQAWIQNATLRQNITFTSKFEEQKYNEIIEASALTADIKILAAGDETEIGEKGINLSGGQKQRVSLARAIYADSDIYLLDDPLSAVDSHVGKHIFDKVIGPSGLLRNKTRVLVTHRIALLPQVDMIIVMKDGRISERGTYQELLSLKGDFAEFLIEYLAEAEEDLPEDELSITDELKSKLGPEIERHLSMRSEEDELSNIQELSASVPTSSVVAEVSNGHTVLERTASTLSATSAGARGFYGSIASVARKDNRSPSKSSTKSLNKSRIGINSNIIAKDSFDKSTGDNQEGKRKKSIKDLHESKGGGKLTETELEMVGGVSWAVYLDYFKAIGHFSCILILMTCCIAYAFNICSSLWLSEWSEDSSDPLRINDTDLRNTRLGVYAGLGLAEAAFVLVSTTVTFLGTLRASELLHNLMLDRILKAPMSFFDTTPVGRILNRFTKDIDALDIGIRVNLRTIMTNLFRTFVTIIVISMQTPYFLIACVPLGIVYYIIQRFYIRSSRQLKRIESNTRSPIYSHFSETITGSSCIRAFNGVEVFIQELESRVDSNSKSYILSLAAARWLAVRLEFMGNIVVLLAAICAVGYENMDPSFAGLSISYALTITSTLNWLVRGSADLENNLVSVERCIEYTKISTEADWYDPTTRPANSWPDKGLVRFEDYSTRYREGLELVLKKVTFETAPNEKVGIVGRTGAGKSSLTLALFRINEATEGKIIIDGVDISRLGLLDFRSKLTIIPQDPVLFTGSLRLNLDPFNIFSDADVWTALELAHLKEFASGLEGGLEFKVSEGGENLSVGQRQLVCLARALLRKSKILVLDEATAAVDLETDDLIQKTIRNEFSGCTIITIAHRLNTVMDYDRILVMDLGQVAEFDTPQNLLSDPSSKFYSMAKDAGLISNEHEATNGRTDP